MANMVKCPICNGTGKREVPLSPMASPTIESPCPDCEGKGVIVQVRPKFIKMDEADKLKEELIQLCDRFARLLEGGDKLCQCWPVLETKLDVPSRQEGEFPKAPASAS